MRVNLYYEHLAGRQSTPQFDARLRLIKAAAFIGDEVVLRHPALVQGEVFWRQLANVAPQGVQVYSAPDPNAQLLSRLSEADCEWYERYSQELRTLFDADAIRTGEQIHGANVIEAAIEFLSPQLEPRVLDFQSEKWLDLLYSSVMEGDGTGWYGGDEQDEIRYAVRAVARESLAARILPIALLYVLICVPYVDLFESDRVLELRSDLADSMSAFRSRVVDIASEATGIPDSDTMRFFEHIGPVLDRDFDEVRKQADASRLLKVLREQLPAAVGAYAGSGLTFAAGAHSTFIGLAALGGTSVVQGLTACLESMRRDHKVTQHPLYWRYDLSKEV